MTVTSARQNETQLGRQQLQPTSTRITTPQDTARQRSMADGSGSGASRWPTASGEARAPADTTPPRVADKMLNSRSHHFHAQRRADRATSGAELPPPPSEATAKNKSTNDKRIATDLHVDIDNQHHHHNHAIVINRAAHKLSSASYLSSIISNKKLALVATLALCSYYLLLATPISVHCAPARSPPTSTTAKLLLLDSSTASSIPPASDGTGAHTTQISSMHTKQDDSSGAERKTTPLAPIIVNNQQSVVVPMSEVEDEEESLDREDDSIVLILADKLDLSSPRTVRRLIKRSGISDQRLAEIQMLRALKKQLEKATKATNSAGQDGGQAAS